MPTASIVSCSLSDRHRKVSKSAVSRQLELSLLARPDASPPQITVTRPLRHHKRCNQIIERVRYVRRYFPELDSLTLKVGLTRAASGMAIMGGTEIWLNPSRLSNHTIAHEFTHLLQARDFGVPQGERSCDVFSLARHWTLNDVPPSYVKVPMGLFGFNGKMEMKSARLIYDVALEAITRREQGLRTYIAFFEKKLQEEARGNSLLVRLTDRIAQPFV